MVICNIILVTCTTRVRFAIIGWTDRMAPPGTDERILQYIYQPVYSIRCNILRMLFSHRVPVSPLFRNCDIPLKTHTLHTCTQTERRIVEIICTVVMAVKVTCCFDWVVRRRGVCLIKLTSIHLYIYIHVCVCVYTTYVYKMIDI